VELPVGVVSLVVVVVGGAVVGDVTVVEPLVVPWVDGVWDVEAGLLVDVLVTVGDAVD